MADWPRAFALCRRQHHGSTPRRSSRNSRWNRGGRLVTYFCCSFTFTSTFMHWMWITNGWVWPKTLCVVRFHTDSHRWAVTHLSDWLIERCLTSAPTQYRLYGRRFLQVKRPNQQYQSTEGNTKDKSNNENNKIHICTENNIHKKDIHKISTSPLVYTTMGCLGDSSHGGQVRQAWTAVGLPPRYPITHLRLSMGAGLTLWQMWQMPRASGGLPAVAIIFSARQ